MQNEELKNLEQRIASETSNLHADIDLLWNVASRIKLKHQQLDAMYKEYRVRLEQKERDLQQRELQILQKERQLPSPVKPVVTQTIGFIAIPTIPSQFQPIVNTPLTQASTPNPQIKTITTENNDYTTPNGATVVVKPQMTISSSTANSDSSPRKIQFSDESAQTLSPVSITPIQQQKPSSTSVPPSPSRLERSQSEQRTLSEKEVDSRIRSFSFEDTTNTATISATNLSQSTTSLESLNKENQSNSSEKPLERYSMFIPFDNPKKKLPPKLSSGSPASKSFVADRIASFTSPPKVPISHSNSSPALTSPSKARPRSTIISKVDFAAFEVENAHQVEYSSPRKTVTSK